MEKYRSRIEEIGKRIAQELHLALYDIEEKSTGKGKVIIVYLTKIGGINLDECAVFSRALSNELEELDIIPERYYLEVSSPGIERVLKLKMHYASAIGELVDVQWKQGDAPVLTQGILHEVNPDNIVIKDGDELIEIPISSIHKAKTCFTDSKTREQL